MIKLGGYAFAYDPSRISPIIEPRKICAAVQTYEGAAFFQFGDARLAGQEVTFFWDVLTSTQYGELVTLVETGGELVLDLFGDASVQYNVNIMSLIGDYFLSIEETDSFDRENVELVMLVMSEVV